MRRLRIDFCCVVKFFVLRLSPVISFVRLCDNVGPCMYVCVCVCVCVVRRSALSLYRAICAMSSQPLVADCMYNLFGRFER
jgi:hypothetical protein